ncbi:MAG: N-formylglutamate amidohydrolase [Polyangiaceae bacterium]|jgi:N-formylglutamate amidohydrolase
MRQLFDIFEPAGAESPVLVEIPHSGLDIPPQFLEPIIAPARALGRDADLYVDTLYDDASAEGATVLVARTSRYVIDLNRSEVDVDDEVVDGARSDIRMQHGLVWRATSQGERALARRLSRQELGERLDRVWRPYHEALSALVERKRARFGEVVVVAAHSMPSVDRPMGSCRTVSRERADVVPGTCGMTTAHKRFLDPVESLARSQGWALRHDDPYAGGYTTKHYGHPAEGIHAIQIELARRLYLNEETLRPTAGFDAVRAWCRALVAELTSVTRRSKA